MMFAYLLLQYNFFIGLGTGTCKRGVVGGLCVCVLCSEFRVQTLEQVVCLC